MKKPEEKSFDRRSWSFVNMNSPADLKAHWTETGGVCLKEYDRCRDGHCLLSGFFLNSGGLEIETAVKSFQSGLAVGVYYGDGCWNKYLGAFISAGGIQVRIPSNVPLGDTFRLEGPKRYYALGNKPMKIEAPLMLRIRITGKEMQIRFNGVEVLSCDLSGVGFIKPAARVFLKAVNEDGKAPEARAEFENIRLAGWAEVFPLSGAVTDASTGEPVAGASVHAAGYAEQWTVSRADGSFVLSGLPAGTYTLVGAKEAMNFTSTEVVHPGPPVNMHLQPQTESHIPRPEDPRVNLWNSNPWESLNGTWSFAFDPEDQGETQKWYAQDQDCFSRAIQVPFSWASLEGFGEGFHAKDHAIHQFNTFIADTSVVGNIGWYKRELRIPHSFDDNKQTALYLGAVTGLARVWLDGAYMGESVDQYQALRFPLGRLKIGSVHRLVIRVDADTDRYPLCTGKQGFWFSRCPGIWQSVWLENCADVGIQDLAVEYRFVDEYLKKVNVHISAALGILPGERDRVLHFPDFTIRPGAAAELELEAATAGVYRLALEYSAGQGLTAAQITTAAHSFCTVFHGTPDFDHRDIKELFIDLSPGKNVLRFTGTVDGRMYGASSCKVSRGWLQRMEEPDTLEIRVFDAGGNSVFESVVKPDMCGQTGTYGTSLAFDLENPHLWEPDAPGLYTVEAVLRQEDKILEECRSTFGIRQVKAAWAPGYSPDVCEVSRQCQYLYINNKVVYIRGILDQGYNPWGIYTYPQGNTPVKGSMAYDIEGAKTCGYNLIRMHIKDNEPLWYRICDQAGMLVWDELPPNFYEKASNPAWRGMFFRQLDAMLKKHRTHPSVILFSTFNESWGVEGGHERSPWADETAQGFITAAVQQYKKNKNNVLVVDNSGYGKTNGTDIVDHHCYPYGYTGSRDFWQRLTARDFPGSTFNFFNKENRQLMQNTAVRDLLQRNCSQPLDRLDYTGDSSNHGQPVLISEFVHTNRNTRLMRIFGKIAGYVRMNLASQENEDTSPLTALRKWRDFGYVDEDFLPLGDAFNNSVNSVVIDSPLLRQVRSGVRTAWDVYGSIWEHETGLEGIRLEWSVTGIDPQGRYIPNLLGESLPCAVKRYEPTKIGTISFQTPGNITALYLFARLCKNGRVLASDYIQLEVLGEERAGSLEVASPLSVDVHGFWGIYREDGRRLFWLSGYGAAGYALVLQPEAMEGLRQGRIKGAILHFEASSCECLDGTRVTDEELCESTLSVSINQMRAGQVLLKDHPCDEKALFSNSATIAGEEFIYEKSGRFGYGERFSMLLPPDLLEEIKTCAQAGTPAKLLFQAGENGMVLYGHRMGRYGFNPYIEWLMV